MKYCLISNLYPPQSVGGAEKIVSLIAKGLKETDQVLVITTFLNGDSGKLIDGNLEIFRLDPENIYNYDQAEKATAFKKIVWHVFDLYNFRVAKKVRKILQQKKPDLVITHNLKGLSYQIPKVISGLQIRHVHTLHDYQLIDPHGSLRRQGKNLIKLPCFFSIYKYICRRLFSKVDLVISPSKFVLDKHLEFGFFKNSEKIVLPNPIEFPRANYSRMAKANGEKINLLYLGQLEEHKGINFLIDVFNSYQNNDFNLMVVGDGSLFNKLKEANLNSRIKFFGKVSADQLREIFQQADLTVVPSLWWDNSPTVIYESYAHKVPVLVSDSGGSKELVKDGKTGFIYESGQASSLTSILDRIGHNKPILSEFGDAGYQFIQKYSLDHYLAKLEEICRDLKK